MCGILKAAAPLEAVTASPGVTTARVTDYATAVNPGGGRRVGGDLEWHLNGVFIATDDLDFPLRPSIKHSLKTPPRPAVAGGNMPA